MSVFVMPSLWRDMEDGKLVEWLVKPGDAVHRGDVVAVVETQEGGNRDRDLRGRDRAVAGGRPWRDAARWRRPGPASGMDQPHRRRRHQTLPNSKPWNRSRNLRTPKPGPEAPEEAAPAVTQAPAAPAHAREGPAEPPPSGSGAMPAPATVSIGVAASPAARAPPPPPPPPWRRKKDIDLAGITGSWPGGAIVLADVERATGVATPMRARAWQHRPHRPEVSTSKPCGRALPPAMARSKKKREIPHYYMTHEDGSPAGNGLAGAQERRCRPCRPAADGRAFSSTATALAAKAGQGNQWEASNRASMLSPKFRQLPACAVAVARRRPGRPGEFFFFSPRRRKTRPWAEVMAAMPRSGCPGPRGTASLLGNDRRNH